MGCVQAGRSGQGTDYRNCNSTLYCSWMYHRIPGSGSHTKAIWSITGIAECGLFCKAESSGWEDSSGTLWGCSKDAAVELGTRGERMACFEPPTQSNGSWHGYPVSGSRRAPKAIRRQPPDSIVIRWHDDGWVSYTVRQRILRKKI
jgi:hypothetical protein